MAEPAAELATDPHASFDARLTLPDRGSCKGWVQRLERERRRKPDTAAGQFHRAIGRNAEHAAIDGAMKRPGGQHQVAERPGETDNR